MLGTIKWDHPHLDPNLGYERTEGHTELAAAPPAWSPASVKQQKALWSLPVSADPQVTWPLLGNPACLRKSNHPFPARLALQTFQPWLWQVVGTSKWDHPTWTPNLGCKRTEGHTKQTCLEPSLLPTAEAHSPVVTVLYPQVALPLLGNPACFCHCNNLQVRK